MDDEESTWVKIAGVGLALIGLVVGAWLILRFGLLALL